MLTQNRPKKSGKNLLLSQAFQGRRRVFPLQSPYLEIDLQILNNFLTVYFLIIIKINDDYNN